MSKHSILDCRKIVALDDRRTQLKALVKEIGFYPEHSIYLSNRSGYLGYPIAFVSGTFSKWALLKALELEIAEVEQDIKALG